MSPLARLSYFAFSILFVCGCAAHTKSAVWVNAPLDEASGKVVTMWAGPTVNDGYGVLQGEYGILLVWGERERQFYVFDNRNKVYFGTTEFEKFLEEVRQLPSHTVVDRVDTCTISRAWKMPAEAWGQLRKVMAEGDKQLMTGARSLYCYCQSKGLRFLDTH